MGLFNRGGLELIPAGGMFVAALGFGQDHGQSKCHLFLRPVHWRSLSLPHEVGLASLTSRDYEEAGRMELARQRAVALKQRPQRDTNRALGPQPPRLKPPSP
jgi:hypothetical protein